MSRSKDFPRGANVGLQALGQDIHLLLQFGKAERPADITVWDIGPAEDDVLFERALEQRQLGIENEAAIPVQGVQIKMPEIHAVVPDDAAGRGLETR